MNNNALKQVKSVCKNDWRTPLWLFNRLHKVFKFEVDGASDGINNLLPEFFTTFEKTTEKLFINPPFNKIEEFLDWYQMANVCFLIPFRPETRYWHKYIWPKARIFIFNKRIQYVHPETLQEVRGAAFPSCLVFYGDLNCNTDELRDLGVFR